MSSSKHSSHPSHHNTSPRWKTCIRELDSANTGAQTRVHFASGDAPTTLGASQDQLVAEVKGIYARLVMIKSQSHSTHLARHLLKPTWNLHLHIPWLPITSGDTPAPKNCSRLASCRSRRHSCLQANVLSHQCSPPQHHQVETPQQAKIIPNHNN